MRQGLTACHRFPQLLLWECYSQIEKINWERSASVLSKRLRLSRRSLSEELLNLVTSSIQNLVVTFRWCCVRVKASEIAFFEFDHLPVAWSNSLPLPYWDVSPNIIITHSGWVFAEQSDFLKRKEPFLLDVHFREALFLCG
jgi:hypothetical protein